ncbi:posphoenolpyruvate synthetase regulatory kinase/phosphorylase PpsR [Hydrogenophilus thermoluteolus]|uniref:Putative phosphoenolpyruvate synthase regulatory protein n=1 Tax=Hydrogenophilus thermoluteolus TaxID=297 RepID=A0A2Z6DZI4_HYDTE|nr:pyruvate, water dikinase regulatory protein [Hydrogenophilus thermoluteolus]MBW7655981.1 kinase/pyrophosphorylase [Hydrogenophilus thermoluteolus]BBD77645.1 phosphoenolpyruvate synthase regulatory protein [Hydrogenophilus thermoluteolus]GLW59900.1 putative phosphoenolpyruvate synthase regulatory protein [Hydrogenophilus thermoluteolus]HCO77034.1 phosphoenolpyruvate synthase regulatory protein [Rhodocyclaceae bacterium]
MPIPRKRHVFYVSDGTGVTAEMLGESLLAQFPDLDYEVVRAPFVDSPQKAGELVSKIERVAQGSGFRPIVFSTLVKPEVLAVIQNGPGLVMDLFGAFIDPLEREFGMESTHTVGRFHGMRDTHSYHRRIEAINFALAHDDGITQDHTLVEADIILIGVSRSGKTPTSLYLAMTYAIKAANYPLIPEDLERMRLPEALRPHREKLFGLTIAPERLAQIRSERRPNSAYADLANCRREIELALELMRREGIPWLDTTTKSIEEIAAVVMLHLEKIRRYQDL